jgi:hypothetical protein
VLALAARLRRRLVAVDGLAGEQAPRHAGDDDGADGDVAGGEGRGGGLEVGPAGVAASCDQQHIADGGGGLDDGLHGVDGRQVVEHVRVLALEAADKVAKAVKNRDGPRFLLIENVVCPHFLRFPLDLLPHVSPGSGKCA